MTSAEIELMKKQIEIQLDEYADAIAAYDQFMVEWRRKRRGFRAKRRQEATARGLGQPPVRGI